MRFRFLNPSHPKTYPQPLNPTASSPVLRIKDGSTYALNLVPDTRPTKSDQNYTEIPRSQYLSTSTAVFPPVKCRTVVLPYPIWQDAWRCAEFVRRDSCWEQKEISLSRTIFVDIKDGKAYCMFAQSLRVARRLSLQMCCPIVE